MGRRPWSERKTVQECNSLSIFGQTRDKPEINAMGGLRYFRISYEIAGESLSYTIELTTTPCNYGGIRYWFLCPQCGKRVAKIYRKSVGRYFVCRTCNNLTYRSCKEHDKRVDAIIKNPHLVARITNLKGARLMFKAYDKMMERRRRYLH